MREEKERDVLAYLKKRVKDFGGELRRVKWIGRIGAPDCRVWLPSRVPIWVETKRRKGKLSAAQEREHKIMAAYGDYVAVAASIREVDGMLMAHATGNLCINRMLVPTLAPGLLEI